MYTFLFGAQPYTSMFVKISALCMIGQMLFFPFHRESDSDMSDEEPEAHIPGEKQAQHDLLLTSTQAKSRTGFFKQAKKMFPMFPYVEEVLTWDDYGEIIKYV